ncbi:hypothetical protein [uncultured Croceicoccus sp.]|uniref:hypothetical protein n=1 Tax=uncultured Croceicoccus sp. TaxID=1295329 RepID=UPI00261A3D1E|nr:hypothetical protein [uncultured Croceicoccus sp.]
MEGAKVAAGLPEPCAEMLLGIFRASRRGDFSTVDATFEKLLDREPTPLRDMLAAEPTLALQTQQK